MCALNYINKIRYLASEGSPNFFTDTSLVRYQSLISFVSFPLVVVLLMMTTPMTSIYIVMMLVLVVRVRNLVM